MKIALKLKQKSCRKLGIHVIEQVLAIAIGDDEHSDAVATSGNNKVKHDKHSKQSNSHGGSTDHPDQDQ